MFVWCVSWVGWDKFCLSNVLDGGEVRSLGEVGVLVDPPFGWTHPFGDG